MPHQPHAQQGIRLHTDFHLRYTCVRNYTIVLCASISAATAPVTPPLTTLIAAPPPLLTHTNIPPPDHIFGCSADELPGIDGVKPGMGNYIDPNDHSKGFETVQCGRAEYVCKHGVDHSFPGTTEKIFGPGKTNGSKVSRA